MPGRLTCFIAPVSVFLVVLLAGCVESGAPTRAQSTSGVSTDQAEPATNDATSSMATRDVKVVVFNVMGMHCGGCADAIQSTVSKLDGVQSCSASFDDGTAEVVLTEPAAQTDVAQAIADLGYTVELQGDQKS